MRKPIPVLYEDDDLVAFDKPSGLLVIPSPRRETQTLQQIVNERFSSNRPCRLHPCHRLDRDTSGVILFAKGKKAQQRMMELFRCRAVHKRYWAFVRGCPTPSQAEIRRPVKAHLKSRRTPPVQAVTRYTVRGVSNGFSVVDVVPLTGRTNQIRIHFSGIGHPLLGERVYAFRRDFPVHFRRLALHAREVSWKDPMSGRPVRIRSPLPEDMKKLLEKHGIPL